MGRAQEETTKPPALHGPEALAKLPQAERQAWQRFWANVADSLAKAEGKNRPGKKPARK
jgi:hypothetical protein